MYFLRAFSLIEILVVVAIVGILSAVAIPSYEHYIVKANVAGLLSTANNYKIRMIENYWEDMTYNNTTEKINTSTIATVTLHTTDTNPRLLIVQIVAKMRDKKERGIGLKQPSNATEPLILQMQGKEIDGNIFWTCHVAAEYHQYVPNSCHNNQLEVLSAI